MTFAAFQAETTQRVWEIAIGMAVTVVALGVAGRRFFFLFRLVKSGKADKGRFKDVPARVWAELGGGAPALELVTWFENVAKMLG